MFFIRFFQIFNLSLNSRSFYKDLYYNVKGLKLKYPLVFILFINLFLAMFFYIYMRDFLGDPSRGNLASQIPQLQIKQGQLFIEKKDPIFLLDGKHKIAVIDVDAFPEKYSRQSMPFMINKNSVFMNNGAGGYSKVLDFSSFIQESQLMSESDFFRILASIHSRLPFSCFFIMLPIMFFSQIFLISVALSALAGIVWGYGKFSKVGFRFKNLFRIMLFASFPALMLDLLIDIYYFSSTSSLFEYYFKVYSPAKRNIVFLVHVGYFVFAVKSVVKSKKFR